MARRSAYWVAVPRGLHPLRPNIESVRPVAAATWRGALQAAVRQRAEGALGSGRAVPPAAAG
jgi:hypothetical protein